MLGVCVCTCVCVCVDYFSMLNVISLNTAFIKIGVCNYVCVCVCV